MPKVIQAKLLDSGIAAYDYAVAHNQKLTINAFKVGTAVGYTPADDQKDILGDLIYASKINGIDVLSPNGVMFTCNVPYGVPETGIANIGELVLFTDTGVAVAAIAYDDVIPKDSQWNIDLQAVIVHTRVAANVTLTVSDELSLPGAYVNSLPSPDVTESSAWVLLDGQDNDVEAQHSDSPTIAVRYVSGAEGVQWGFVGQSRVYRGAVPVVAGSRSEFTFDPVVNGFWLNDNETVIVATDIESRRCVFDLEMKRFTVVDSPFTALNTGTAVSIWRRNTNENALPSRKEVPRHYALHPGRDEASSASTLSSTGALRMRYMRIAFDGATRVYSLGVISDQIKNAAVFMDDGTALDPASYMVGDYLAFDEIYAAGRAADVYVWYFVATEGAMVEWFEDTTTANGSTDTFSTAGPIKSYNDCMIFLDNKLISPSHFVLQSTSIKFDFNPTGKLNILRYSQPQQENFAGGVHQYSYITNGSQQSVTLPYEITNKNLALVFSNGKYVPKSEYSANDDEITHNNVPANGTQFNIFVFSNKLIPFDPSNDARLNTGPEWRDPAGFFTEPNLFRPHQLDFVAKNGDQRFFIPRTMKPYNSQYIWVFVGSILQRPNSYEVAPSLLEVKLNTPLLAGQKVSLLVFEAIESTGYRTEFVAYTPAMSEILAGTFKLPVAPTDNQTVLVFAGSLLQQRSNWSLANTLLQSNEQLHPGVRYQVYIFSQVRATGFTTEVRRVTTSTRTGYKYRTLEEVIKGNTMFFVGSLLQLQSSYNYNQKEVDWDELMPNGIKVDLCYFFSNLPRTRLVTRDELETQYIPLTGGLINGVIEQPFPPVGDGDLVTKQELERQVAELRDTIAALTRNLNS